MAPTCSFRDTVADRMESSPGFRAGGAGGVRRHYPPPGEGGRDAWAWPGAVFHEPAGSYLPSRGGAGPGARDCTAGSIRGGRRPGPLGQP